jgi:hypothetical protein
MTRTKVLLPVTKTLSARTDVEKKLAPFFPFPRSQSNGGEILPAVLANQDGTDYLKDRFSESVIRRLVKKTSWLH